MNWIKENTRRVKEGLLQSLGAHQATDDREFESRALSYAQFMRDLERVNEALTIWSDCLDAFSMASAGLSESLCVFFAANGRPGKFANMDTPSKALLVVQADLNDQLRPSIRKVLLEKCIRPIAEILSGFPLINEKIAARKKLVLDVDFYSSKLKADLASTKDKNDPKILKVSNKLEEASKALDDAQNELIAHFDAVDAARASVLTPELAAFVACQFHFLHSSTMMFSNVMNLFPQSGSTSCILRAERAEAEAKTLHTVSQLKLQKENGVRSAENSSSSFTEVPRSPAVTSDSPVRASSAPKAPPPRNPPPSAPPPRPLTKPPSVSPPSAPPARPPPPAPPASLPPGAPPPRPPAPVKVLDQADTVAASAQDEAVTKAKPIKPMKTRGSVLTLSSPHSGPEGKVIEFIVKTKYACIYPYPQYIGITSQPGFH
jgi:hypothetical protein